MKRRSAKKWLRSAGDPAVPVVLLGVILCAWALRGFTYSVGDRVGVVQKVSKRGWVCERVTGDLSMATSSDGIWRTFDFNVRDSSIAKQLDDLTGHRVVVHYEHNKGIPSRCFGGSGYLVTGVRRID